MVTSRKLQLLSSRPLLTPSVALFCRFLSKLQQLHQLRVKLSDYNEESLN